MSRRTGSTPLVLNMSVRASMSPCMGTSLPADATDRRHWCPRYASSPFAARSCTSCACETRGACTSQVESQGSRMQRSREPRESQLSAAAVALACLPHERVDQVICGPVQVWAKWIRAYQIMERRAAQHADHVGIHHELPSQDL